MGIVLYSRRCAFLGPQYGYFSKTKGKLPHRPLPKVRVIVGRPRSFKLKDELRRQRDHISNEVYMILREMSFEVRYNPDISLFAQLMKTAKIHAKKGLFRRPKFVEDIQRKPQSYRDIVIKSFVLGKYLKRRTEPEEHVGLFLPNSVAALCSFFGLTAYDRIPVMLNFSVGAQNMVSMCKTAQVRIVVTSLAFVKTAKMEDAVKMMEEAGVKIIYLEKAAKEIGLWDKINAYLRYKIKRVPIKKGGNRKHSKIDTLPPEMKATVEEMIMDGSATYSDIVTYLEQQGYSLSVSSVCRYAQGYVENLQTLQIAQANFLSLIHISEPTRP